MVNATTKRADGWHSSLVMGKKCLFSWVVVDRGALLCCGKSTKITIEKMHKMANTIVAHFTAEVNAAKLILPYNIKCV